MTLALTLAAFALAMLLMAIGVMVTGRRLKGSCGGVGPGSDCFCKREGINPVNCPRKGDGDEGPPKDAPDVDPSRLRRGP
jgi:hypothetical protein